MRHTAMAMNAPPHFVMMRGRATGGLQTLARLVAASLVAFGLCAAAIVLDGLTDQTGASDVAIVPGSKVNPDGTPSPRLAARLDRAVTLYRQDRVKLVIVSGGTGMEGFDEAAVMRAYVIAHGVPASAVLTDSAGVTTRATAVNSAALMKARKLRTAAVVTQYFHVSRTTLALRQAGVTVNQTAHAHIFELRDLYSLPREVIGYAAYLRG